MALDSAAKRASALSYLRPYVPGLPLPDGTIDAGDRAHVLNLYNGVSPAPPVMSAFGRRQRTRRVMAAFYEEAA